MARRVVRGVRAPDLFVIGAMKCGTTSLHSDLSTHPRTRIAQKEAGLLATVESERSRRSYLEQWRGASSTDVLVDVSASYSMVPHQPAVAERAAKLNPEAKALYLCREPITRIVSHHHHDLAGGVTGPDIDHAVREDARFVDYTRYGTQLEPWLRHLGPRAVRVLRFEDYVANRQAAVSSLATWLGLEPSPDDAIDEGVINATSSTRRASLRTRQLISSDLYRNVVRPIVPRRVRDTVARRVLTAPLDRPAPPSEVTVAWLREKLVPEIAHLAALTHGTVTWPEWRPTT